MNIFGHLFILSFFFFNEESNLSVYIILKITVHKYYIYSQKLSMVDIFV